MGTLTIRMQDAAHERLRELARMRRVSVNKLIEELSIAALAEFDAETRFRIRAARGDTKRGLALLAKLDRAAKGRVRKQQPAADGRKSEKRGSM